MNIVELFRKEVLSRLDLGGYISCTWGQPVTEFMTRDPQSLGAQESICEALRLMNNGHYRNVPIVDEDSRIEGNLPQHEIIDFLSNQFPKDIYNFPPRSRTHTPYQRRGLNMCWGIEDSILTLRRAVSNGRNSGLVGVY